MSKNDQAAINKRLRRELNGLSCRIINAMINAGFTSGEEVKEALKSGKLRYTKPKPKNFGKRSYIELCGYFGITDDPQPKNFKNLPPAMRDLYEAAEKGDFEAVLTKKMLNIFTEYYRELICIEFNIYESIGYHAKDIIDVLNNVIGSMPEDKRKKYGLEEYYNNLSSIFKGLISA